MGWKQLSLPIILIRPGTDHSSAIPLEQPRAAAPNCDLGTHPSQHQLKPSQKMAARRREPQKPGLAALPDPRTTRDRCGSGNRSQDSGSSTPRQQRYTYFHPPLPPVKEALLVPFHVARQSCRRSARSSHQLSNLVPAGGVSVLPEHTYAAAYVKRRSTIDCSA
jgi:hypothetical protein